MPDIPILYSFRRCPFAMRARLGLMSQNIRFEWREILLREKPADFLAVSADATVPVLQIGDIVLQESIDILKLCFEGRDFDDALISWCDHDFKPLLDAYKYKDDFEARNHAIKMLKLREHDLHNASLQTGFAIWPFIRQFAHVDFEWFENLEWESLSAELENFKQSATFTKIMTKHKPWQKGDQPLIYGEKTLKNPIESIDR